MSVPNAGSRQSSPAAGGRLEAELKEYVFNTGNKDEEDSYGRAIDRDRRGVTSSGGRCDPLRVDHVIQDDRMKTVITSLCYARPRPAPTLFSCSFPKTDPAEQGRCVDEIHRGREQATRQGKQCGPTQVNDQSNGTETRLAVSCEAPQVRSTPPARSRALPTAGQ